jgi:cytidylate kinase
MIAIAIDGPSAAGKSTLAKRLAKELGYIYVDTGALYRAIGLHAVRQGVSPADAERVAALLPHVRLSVDYSPEGQRVLLNGEDVSQAIRSPEMGMAASAVSAHPAVRAFLLEQQRDMARHSNLVMDGRDIGTVVLPDAQYKIFLTATPEARTHRRMRDHQARGEQVDYESLLRDILKRDEQDTNRPIAPLRPAEDAVIIDSTHLTLDEVVKTIKALMGRA